MIPKIIHYCWFGGKPLPNDAKKYIASWKKYLPDYKIIEWNESNFNLDLYPFTREALDNKKYAFITDVVRLYVLKEYGGIYMDTDVEVLKSLESFLHHTAFSGFENDNYVPTGIMASEKNGKWVTELLKYYNNRSFIRKDGTFDMESNTSIITTIMKTKGFIMDNTFQEIKNYVAFYPNEYFCPKSYKTGQVELTKNSYCIHHFAKSWIAPRKKYQNIIKMKVMNVIGHKNLNKIIDFIKRR